MKKRYIAVVVVAVFVGIGMASGPSADQLAKVTVQSSLSRSGFGTVTIGSFSIYNDNEFAIKDPVVRCSHHGASGSEIDWNSRTIYKDVPAHGSAYAGDINMGFTVTPQITDSVCTVTSFTQGQKA